MADITHRVGIKSPLSQVYAAISTVEGIAGWWTQQTSGSSKIGGTFGVRFHSPDGKEIGHMEMEVLTVDPNKTVRWRVRCGPDEWVGTDVVFNLSQDGEYTIVLFGHKNWRASNEFMAHCNMKWAIFLLSLKELVETGKGRPSPDDIKIDDWNCVAKRLYNVFGDDGNQTRPDTSTSPLSLLLLSASRPGLS